MHNRNGNDAPLRRGFSLLQMLYWCSAASSASYIVSFVTSRHNASASESGNVLMVYMLCACLGQFFINALCDRLQNNRRMFMLGMGISLVLWAAAYFSPNLILMTVFFCAMGFLLPAMSAVLDTWLIRSFPYDGNAYSPIRAMGSLAYSAVMLTVGLAIDSIGHSVMLFLPIVFSCGVIGVAYFMPEVPAIDREARNRLTAGSSKVPSVMWMLIASMAIMGIANTPLLNMNLLIIENAGGTVAHSGISVCFNTVAEFVTMQYIMRRVGQLKAHIQLLLVGGLYLLSTTMMLLIPGIFTLYIAFAINGVAYGIMMPARRQFVCENVPDNLLNRMQGIGDMAYTNAGGLISSRLAGGIIDGRGVGALLGLSLTLEAVSFALMTTFGRLQKKSAKETIDSAA